MSTLRWILLIFGIILIVGIYFLGRSKDKRKRIRREPALEDELLHAVNAHKNEPDFPLTEAIEDIELHAEKSPIPGSVESVSGEVLDDGEWLDFESLIKESVSPVASSPTLSQKAPPKPPPSTPPPKDVKSGSRVLLDGDLVVLHAFAREPRRIEGRDLYTLLEEHDYVRGKHDVFYKNSSNQACIVANAFKPGTFPETPEEFETRGVSLVLQLSKTDRPMDRFDDVLALAHAFQEKLDCRLYDSQRSSLTRQTITYLQDEIQQYQFRHHS